MSDLRNVPGVGAKTEQTLIALGYDSLAALREADPDELYPVKSGNFVQSAEKNRTERDILFRFLETNAFFDTK